MPSGTGNRRDPLDLHHSPALERARKRRVTLPRSGHLRARVFRHSEIAGADQETAPPWRIRAAQGAPVISPPQSQLSHANSRISKTKPGSAMSTVPGFGKQ
jgi:hypothetical protein